jgi:hypothetical protein
MIAHGDIQVFKIVVNHRCDSSNDHLLRSRHRDGEPVKGSAVKATL